MKLSDGSEFRAWLPEEKPDGVEFSAQGLLSLARFYLELGGG